MSARRCCAGHTYVRAVGTNRVFEAWEVLCEDCDRVLAEGEGPREEVYAHM